VSAFLERRGFPLDEAKARAAATNVVLDDIRDERDAQDTKWGTDSTPPDGTGPTTCPLLDVVGEGIPAEDLARYMQEVVEQASAGGHVTMAQILLEEVFEAVAENDADALRAELVQVAAVATKWVERIDKRGTDPSLTNQEASA